MENMAKRIELSNEIVKIACEKGKGMLLGEVIMALKEAEGHFYRTTRVTDGMLAEAEK